MSKWYPQNQSEHPSTDHRVGFSAEPRLAARSSTGIKLLGVQWVLYLSENLVVDSWITMVHWTMPVKLQPESDTTRHKHSLDFFSDI